MRSGRPTARTWHMHVHIRPFFASTRADLPSGASLLCEQADEATSEVRALVRDGEGEGEEKNYATRGGRSENARERLRDRETESKAMTMPGCLLCARQEMKRQNSELSKQLEAKDFEIEVASSCKHMRPHTETRARAHTHSHKP